MRQFGIIGFPLGHSFSKKYFTQKFLEEGIKDCVYENYPLDSLSSFPALIRSLPGLCGLNVTIPYKQQVLSYLDGLDEGAQKIGAVNCIDFQSAKTTGYNTDAIGFEKSLQPLLKAHHQRALILGSGGASRAVAFVLEKLKIPYIIVSREPRPGNSITYQDLDRQVMNSHYLIINTSPVGMAPNIDQAPQIPYSLLQSRHLLYDLVYNPETTIFLQKGEEFGAATKNGYQMLLLQAEAAWQIWNAE
ncbi:MAG: shikimate dehydrogenase family protein [Chitinophagaceae bacterium]